MTDPSIHDTATRTAPAPTDAVAWVVMSSDADNIRIWWRDKERAEKWAAEHDQPLIPLYAKPFAAADFLALSTSTKVTTATTEAIADAKQDILNAIEAIDIGLLQAARMHMHKAVRNLTYAADAAVPAMDRAAVIEECAKVCGSWIQSKNLHESLAATDIARDIRALSDAKGDGK